MDKPKGKPRGRPFPKGNKYGKGRPPVTNEVKELRKIGRERFQNLLIQYDNNTKDELTEIVKADKTKAVEFRVAALLLQAMKGKDYRLNEWINKTAYGKW